jgi:hypothetical protein
MEFKRIIHKNSGEVKVRIEAFLLRTRKDFNKFFWRYDNDFRKINHKDIFADVL